MVKNIGEDIKSLWQSFHLSIILSKYFDKEYSLKFYPRNPRITGISRIYPRENWKGRIPV
jgi:hypothetical protein